MKFTFDLQRFDEVSITAGDSYKLDGVTYTALEDSQLNLDSNGKVSGIASGKVTAVVTGATNSPTVTFDAAENATPFNLSEDNGTLALTLNGRTFKFSAGTASVKGDNVTLGAATFSVAGTHSNADYEFRVEKSADFSITTDAFIISSEKFYVSVFTGGTTISNTFGNYTFSATADDNAGGGFTFTSKGITFTPADSDGKLSISVTRGDTPIFARELSVSGGSIFVNHANRTIGITDGTTISLALGDYELIATANGDASTVMTLTDNGIVVKPNTGDGSLDLTLKSEGGSMNANLEVLSGSFVLGEGGNITVTKGTELRIDFGGGYVINFKATDDAGGAISLGADGITFKPDSSDGGLEISITRDGQTRSASLDVTGSVTYKLDGSISLAKDTVVRNVFDSGRVLTITANTDASGSIIFSPQNGLTITPSTPDALSLTLDMEGVRLLVNKIDGTVIYKSGIVTLTDGTEINYDSPYFSSLSIKTAGGTSALDFNVANKTVYMPSDDAVLTITNNNLPMIVKFGTLTIGNGANGKPAFVLSAGTNFKSNTGNIALTLERAGTYTLNGMNITTTKDNTEVVLTDYSTVTFAADSGIKVSTAEGGKGLIFLQDENTRTATLATGEITLPEGSETQITTKLSGNDLDVTIAAKEGQGKVSFGEAGDITYDASNATLQISMALDDVIGESVLPDTFDISNGVVTMGATDADGIKTVSVKKGTKFSFKQDGMTITGVAPSDIEGKLWLKNGQNLYFRSDKEIAFDTTVAVSDKTIFSGTMKFKGIISYSAAGGTVGLVDSNTYGVHDSYLQVSLGEYSIKFNTNGETVFGALGTGADGKIIFDFINENYNSSLLTLNVNGKPIFSSDISVTGAVILDPATQSIGLKDGATVSLAFGDYELVAKANGNAASILSFTDNGIVVKPNTGDGSLDLTLKSEGGSMNANLEVLSGSFILGEGGKLTVTKGTELRIDFGGGYIVNFKATDDAGGSISLGTDGITFKPGSDDGGLELSITRDGQTRTASLDVTGSVTYKLDGSISLAKGTVVRNVFDSGNVLTITANTDASGSMVFTPDGGLTITPATPDALTLSVTTASGLNGNFNEITGTVTYKGGSLILADGTSFVGTYDAQTSTGGTTFKSEGGDGIIIPTDDGFAIISEDGAKVSVVNERNHGCFVNDGKATFYLTTLQYSISEGSNVEISTPRFPIVLETAGNYTLNGMNIATTQDNVQVTLSDYDTVAFAADAPVKVSTAEGGKLFMVAQSDGMIQATTKATNNVEVTSGSITFDSATRKYSCAAGTTVTFTQGGQVITFTADKDISATYKVEEDIYYFMLDGGAKARVSLSGGGQTIAGDLELGGVLSYRPSTGTIGLTGGNSSHGDGTNTFANLTLKGRTSGSTYDIRAATHDTTVVFVPDLVDGKLEINFPNERKHALNFTFSKDGQTLFDNHVVIDGTIGIDNATQELTVTKGTSVDLNAGDFSTVFTANDDASVKLSVDNGKILLTPKDGDGSLDVTIKRGDTTTFSGNVKVTDGSIVLAAAAQTIGLTKGTLITLTQGTSNLQIKALDDTSGKFTLTNGEIRFAPTAGDGALELNFANAGRKVALNVTGAIVYGGEGKISLEDGTVIDLTWDDGTNLKMTSHGSTGSIAIDPQRGLKITSDDENLDIALTTPAGVQTNISGIKGTIYYNAGTISFEENSTITATTTLGGQPIFTTLETIGGTGHLSFADNGTVYAADTGAMKITWSRDDKASTFTLNSGTIQIGHNLFKIAEGSDLSTDLKDLVPALYFTTTDAGTYTLNGQKITTTTADIPITATDDMMTFNLRGGEISVDDLTFTGRGDVMITAEAVTVGNGVEVAGLGKGKSFVLTEEGNVTVDNRIFELTENVPTGISVTGTAHGFEFARTITAQSEERLGIANSTDIGKIFKESFTARGDDGYRVQTDLTGLQKIIGITAPVTVKASAYVGDEPEETLFDIVTDSAGVVKIGDKPYTISGDSSVVVKADFEPDKSYVRGFDDLNGTVSGDFTAHAVSLDGGSPIIVHGDRAIDIAKSSLGAEIFNLSNRATLDSLGGVSKVHTDTAGTFQFGVEDDSLGVTIRGDDNVTFDFDKDQKLTGISGIEGDIIFSQTVAALTINGITGRSDGEFSSLGAYDGLIYVHDVTDGTTITTKTADKYWLQQVGASMALNDNTFTLAEDDDGIWIRNKEIVGLDEGASLTVSEAGSYVVNGETLTLGKDDIVLGFGDAGAYVYDANDPLVTRKTTAAELTNKFKPNNTTVVEEGGVYNISMSGGDLAVVEKTAARVNITAGDDTVVSQGRNVHVSLTGGNTWLFPTGGKMTLEGYDATTGMGFDVNYKDLSTAIQSGTISFDEGKLSIGSATVNLGTRNEIVNFFDRGGTRQAVGFASHNGELDASDWTEDLIIVGDTFSTLRGGTGDDTIFAAEGSFVDAGGGLNLITLPETRNGYTGATVSLSGGKDTIENFSAGFDHSSDNIAGGGTWKNVFDGTNVSITTDNGSAVLSGAGNGEAFVNFKELVDGVEYKTAVAQKNSVIAADDELADMYYGENSGVDFTGYSGTLNVDLRNNGLPHFYGINRVTAGEGSATLIGSAGNETLTAGTAKNSIWGGAGNDLLRGNTSDDKGGSTEFFFVAGDGKDVIRDFEFYDGSNFATADKINVGTDEVTSVTADANGNVRLQLNGGDDWLTLNAAQGKDFRINNLIVKVDTTALAFDDEANCFVATGNNATLTVDEHAAVWLDGTHGTYYLGDIKTLDATKSNGENILAGNALDNTIAAGSGKASLWGGDSGNDMLIGGAGKDMFFYAYGNGDDTISGTNDGDVVNLAGVTLAEIASTEIAQGSVTINFADGGRLNVEGSAAVEFALNGETYLADHASNTWAKK